MSTYFHIFIVEIWIDTFSNSRIPGLWTYHSHRLCFMTPKSSNGEKNAPQRSVWKSEAMSGADNEWHDCIQIYTLWSSNMAMDNPLWMEVFIRKSLIDGPYSSTSCLIAGGYVLPYFQGSPVLFGTSASTSCVYWNYSLRRQVKGMISLTRSKCVISSLSMCVPKLLWSFSIAIENCHLHWVFHKKWWIFPVRYVNV